MPVHRAEALVLGSGAAGLRAAVELKRRGVDVMVATQSVFGGTSACSGSDKQTLHAANRAVAATISTPWPTRSAPAARWTRTPPTSRRSAPPRALASLQFMGLPLPQDRLGGVLRYQTDHDEAGRATSCGPRTSRLMVQVLASEAIRLEIPFFNHRHWRSPSRRARTAAAARRPAGDAPEGTIAGQSDGVCRVSYGHTRHRRGRARRTLSRQRLSAALLRRAWAGAGSGNSKRSISPRASSASGRRETDFPGICRAPMCRHALYFLARRGGSERNFLADYYRTTQELASNIFRKGYQWPFHATRMLDFGSSLVDLAIVRERHAGRRVFMDFNRNPLPGAGRRSVLARPAG